MWRVDGVWYDNATLIEWADTPQSDRDSNQRDILNRLTRYVMYPAYTQLRHALHGRKCHRRKPERVLELYRSQAEQRHMILYRQRLGLSHQQVLFMVQWYARYVGI